MKIKMFEVSPLQNTGDGPEIPNDHLACYETMVFTLVPRKCFQTPIEINASILALKSEIFRHCSTARPKKKLSWFLNTEVQKFEMGPAKMLFSKTVSLKSRRSWQREIDFVKFFQFVEMTCVFFKEEACAVRRGCVFLKGLD